jgi:hypothetical protein
VEVVVVEQQQPIFSPQAVQGRAAAVPVVVVVVVGQSQPRSMPAKPTT